MVFYPPVSQFYTRSAYRMSVLNPLDSVEKRIDSSV